MTYDQAFERLIGHEGGFQRDPADRGNWTGGAVGKGDLNGTKYGISAMSYPAEDIQNLTLERAKALYLRDFWNPAGCTAVSPAIRFDLFDAAVNSGVGRAVRLLQRACNAAEDGQLGPKTLQALSSMPEARLIARFNGARLAMMTSLPTWPSFSRGWANRIASNLLEA